MGSVPRRFLAFMKDIADVIIIGAGACGLFTAINIAEKAPHMRIRILEKSKEALSKVRISAGGRFPAFLHKIPSAGSPPME